MFREWPEIGKLTTGFGKLMVNLNPFHGNMPEQCFSRKASFGDSIMTAIVLAPFVDNVS